jgi:uncharacterized protein YuzE
MKLPGVERQIQLFTVHNAFFDRRFRPRTRETQMIFEYFPDTDMLYIKLTDAPSAESEEIAPGLVLDFDVDNRVVGVEIEDASQQIDLSRLELKALPISRLLITERVAMAH